MAGCHSLPDLGGIRETSYMDLLVGGAATRLECVAEAGGWTQGPGFGRSLRDDTSEALGTNSACAPYGTYALRGEVHVHEW
jgi:hypothetical protein